MSDELVFVASPLAASPRYAMLSNLKYARRCVKDSFDRREAPYAPHLLYPQVLDDTVSTERLIGMQAAMLYLEVCDVLAVYYDRGVSSGMRAEIDAALLRGMKIELRCLGDEGALPRPVIDGLSVLNEI